MSYSALNYLLMFGSSFFMVFLLGLQSKNVNQGHYLAAIITSFGISVANFLFVKYAAAGDYLVFAVCATGGCCGIAASIWFYKHVIERRQRRNQPTTALTIRIDVDADEAVRRLKALNKEYDRYVAMVKR